MPSPLLMPTMATTTGNESYLFQRDETPTLCETLCTTQCHTMWDTPQHARHTPTLCETHRQHTRHTPTQWETHRQHARHTPMLCETLRIHTGHTRHSFCWNISNFFVKQLSCIFDIIFNIFYLDMLHTVITVDTTATPTPIVPTDTTDIITKLLLFCWRIEEFAMWNGLLLVTPIVTDSQ